MAENNPITLTEHNTIAFETTKLANVAFEDIRKANESIKATDIKGKEYAEVNQRIKAFRMVYPIGYIDTSEQIENNGVREVRAKVGYYTSDGERILLATGTAYEKEGSTFINKTSYVENCETSAVGRALGMAGFGIDTSVASAEEVQNAQANQNNNVQTTINNDQWKSLKMMYSTEEIKAMYKELGITTGKDIPIEYYLKKEKEYNEKFQEEHPEKPFY